MKTKAEKLPLFPDARSGNHIPKLFRDYINHAKILHATGHPEYYRKVDRIEALEKCNTYLQLYGNRPYSKLCKVIPQLKKDLETILPVPSNSSFESTRHRLTYLLILCDSVEKQNS